MINNILVICIGNICRSPMAEGLLQRAFPGKTVHSAGIGAMIGYPADPFSLQIMQEQGVDISAHRARSLNTAMVSAADIILTMDLEQKRFVEQRYASARGKVFRLGEHAKYDIPDPHRQDIQAFLHAYDLISQGVDVLVKRISQIN